jgi:nitrite reductase/ring-hydroxylating ferredoxin subunit
MPEPSPAPAPLQGPGIALCASAELAESGRAWVWEVLWHGHSARAFALRHEGRVVAYLNRCAHVPVEMDWQPGELLDADKRFIVCSIHGASYEPQSGHCVGGPCGRGRLVPITVVEREAQVHWYPSPAIQAVPGAPPMPPETSLPP